MRKTRFSTRRGTFIIKKSDVNFQQYSNCSCSTCLFICSHCFIIAFNSSFSFCCTLVSLFLVSSGFLSSLGWNEAKENRKQAIYDTLLIIKEKLFCFCDVSEVHRCQTESCLSFYQAINQWTKKGQIYFCGLNAVVSTFFMHSLSSFLSSFV